MSEGTTGGDSLESANWAEPMIASIVIWSSGGALLVRDCLTWASIEFARVLSL